MTARSKVVWLDRTLVTSWIYYGICTTPRAFAAEMQRIGVPPNKRPDFPSDERFSTTHFFERKGKTLAIVTIAPNHTRTGVQIAALLVHEAAHIWQAIRKDFGETNPSDEFEAQALQHISQELMLAYADSIKRRR